MQSTEEQRSTGSEGFTGGPRRKRQDLHRYLALELESINRSENPSKRRSG